MLMLKQLTILRIPGVKPTIYIIQTDLYSLKIDFPIYISTTSLFLSVHLSVIPFLKISTVCMLGSGIQEGHGATMISNMADGIQYGGLYPIWRIVYNR